MTLRSYRRWKKIKSFSTNIYKKFDLCCAQNNETFKRLKFLGAKKVVKLGNLKFATSKKVKNEFLEKKYSTFFEKKRILITAASTHFN